MQESMDKRLFNVNFLLNARKQKFLIEIMLAHSTLSITDLAELIGTPAQVLSEVRRDKAYLDGNPLENLVNHFFIFCGS